MYGVTGICSYSGVNFVRSTWEYTVDLNSVYSKQKLPKVDLRA